MRVSCVVDDSFELDFVLLAAHLGIDFLLGSELIGFVDVDVVGFDVVGDGVVVFGFPKPGLPAVRLRLNRFLTNKLIIIYLNYYIFEYTSFSTSD